MTDVGREKYCDLIFDEESAANHKIQIIFKISQTIYCNFQTKLRTTLCSSYLFFHYLIQLIAISKNNWLYSTLQRPKINVLPLFRGHQQITLVILNRFCPLSKPLTPYSYLFLTVDNSTKLQKADMLKVLVQFHGNEQCSTFKNEENATPPLFTFSGDVDSSINYFLADFELCLTN